MMTSINGLSAQAYSRQHCNKGTLDCSWYHGSWHLLKSLGVVSTSAVHEQSIRELLTLALDGIAAPRVLLTGSTDETLVRLVHDTCQAIGIQAQLYAVDICPTPLAFMQAYAGDNHISLTTFCSDILEFDAENNFDIILTHAFMGYFDDTHRPMLVNKWKQLLSAQGKIITIQRIRPADAPAQVRFTPEQAVQFVDTAVDTAVAQGISQTSELENIRRAASEFAKKFVNYSITSKSALESLFVDAGLDFRFIEYHRLSSKAGLAGPSVPSNAEFAHIIAEKSSR